MLLTNWFNIINGLSRLSINRLTILLYINILYHLKFPIFFMDNSSNSYSLRIVHNSSTTNTMFLLYIDLFAQGGSISMQCLNATTSSKSYSQFGALFFKTAFLTANNFLKFFFPLKCRLFITICRTCNVCDANPITFNHIINARILSSCRLSTSNSNFLQNFL